MGGASTSPEQEGLGKGRTVPGSKVGTDAGSRPLAPTMAADLRSSTPTPTTTWVCLACGAPKQDAEPGVPCPAGCGMRVTSTPGIAAALASDLAPVPISAGTTTAEEF